MGVIKSLLLLSGVPVRPSTTRERSRGYQRDANRLARQQNELLAEQLRLQQEIGSGLQPDQATNLGPDSGNQPPAEPLDEYDKLERLARLHASGVLTDSEFKTQKEIVLRRILDDG